MKHQKYRHVTAHNSRWTFQLLILGHPCRTNAHFDTPEEAALACDLVKHYLASEFKLVLPPSLDPEQFSSLAYSRRHVDLSDYLSVLKSMPEDVKDFLHAHRPALLAHKASAPPETTASKFRRSGMIEIPMIRGWVEKLEAAEDDAAAFATIDADSFFLRLKVVAGGLTTALKSLQLAIRMHEPRIKMHQPPMNPRLLQRKKNLAELVHNFQLNLNYVVDLTKTLKEEQAEVENAVSLLEANRPALT